MRTLIKFLLGAVVVVVALVVVAIGAFALLFDADDYKSTVQTLVKDRTGRDLDIAGDLSVTYFPWLGFEIGPTTLSDAPGYSDQPFASFEAASARVKLIPLLSKQVEIGQLALEGLDLELVRKADGSTNWDDLVAGANDQPQPEAADEEGGGLQALSIGGIRLTDANVRFNDAGTVYAISGWNLETGELTPNKPFDFETQLALSASEPEVSGTLEAAGELTTDIEAGRYTLASPDVRLNVSGKGLPAGSVGLTLDGDRLSIDGENVTLDGPAIAIALAGGDLPLDTLDVNLETPRLDVAGTSVSVASPTVAFKGTGSGDKALSALDGRLETASIDVTDGNAFKLPGIKLTVDAAGPSLPGNKVDATLSTGAVSGSVDTGTLNAAQVALNALGLRVTIPSLEGSRLTGKSDKPPKFTGSIAVDEFSPRKLAGDLDVELPATADDSVFARAALKADFTVTDRFARLRKMRLDLDDTRATGKLSVENFDKQSLRFDLAVDEIDADRYLPPPTEPDESAPVEAVEIPGEQIRALNIKGELDIGKLIFAGIRSKDVKIGLLAKDGSVRVHPSTAKLYGGTYSGDIRVDATGDKPVLSMNEQLTDVKFGDLSRDLFDAQKLTGTVNGRVALTGTGDEISELRRTLNGTAEFVFADGAYEGVDLWHEISKGMALVRKEPMPAGMGAGRTAFSDMSGTATVTDGIVRSNDLSVSLPFMRVTGEGTIDLPEQTIDYRVKAKVIRSPELTEEASRLAGRTVPVSITGPLGSPKVRPDVGAAVAGMVEDKIKEEVEDKLGDLLGGALRGRRSDKDAEGDGAQDGEQKEEEEKKPRDLLKDLLGGG